MDILLIWILFFKKLIFKPVTHMLIRLIISLQLNFLCSLYILTDSLALQIFPYSL
jgi:hypothetical protein